MPRYDYECSECGLTFELKQSFDADPEGVCPRCSGSSRRKFHAVPIIYKGSGFYTTDYKGTGYSPPDKDVKDGKDGKEDSTETAQATAEKAKIDDSKKAEALLEKADAAKKGA